MITKIFLIRHAEAEGNLFRMAHGQYDSNITPRGYRQLHYLRERFNGVHLDAVYGSDLTRAHTAASALYVPRGLPFRPLPQLREVRLGDWEERTWAEIKRRYPEMYVYFNKRPDLWQVAGAETFQAVAERTVAAVRRMAEEGHTLGNHTCSHPDMSRIAGEEAFRRELEDNEALCREAAGVELSKLYRPPQGKYSRRNLEMAQALGYRTVFWSLAYVDWLQDDQPTKTEAFQKLLPRVHPGAIVLLHTTSSTNAAILDELLTQWEQLGYQFGDLEQALSCGENLEDNSQLELWHSPAPVQ